MDIEYSDLFTKDELDGLFKNPNNKSDLIALRDNKFDAMSPTMQRLISGRLQSQKLGQQLATDPTLQSPLQRLGQAHPFVGHLMGELGTAGSDIGHTLRELTKPAAKGIGQALAGPAGGEFLSSIAPGPLPERDPDFYYKAMGVKPSSVDPLLSSTLGFVATAPVGEAAGVKAAGALSDLLGLGAKGASRAATIGSITGGGAVGGGAVSPDSPGAGALSGALGGAALGGAGEALGGVRKGIGKWLTTYGQKELGRQAWKTIGPKLDESHAGEALKNAYDSHISDFKSSNDKAVDIADRLDKEIGKGKRFDNSSYTNYITNFVNDQANRSAAQKVPYEDAAEFAAEQLASKPTGFKDVLQVRKNLNTQLGKFLTQKQRTSADKNTLDFIRGLKGKLGDVINDNKSTFNKDDLNSLSTHWNNSNKYYSDAQQVSQIPNAVGKISTDKDLLNVLRKGDVPEPKIAQKYILGGNQGKSALVDAIGSGAAKKTLLNHVMGDVKRNGDFDLSKMVSKYDKLNPNLKDFLFSPKESKVLDLLSKTKAQSKMISSLPFHKRSPLLHALPLALGGAEYARGGSLENALGAAALVTALEHGAPKLLARPSILRLLNPSETGGLARKTGALGGLLGSVLDNNEK